MAPNFARWHSLPISVLTPDSTLTTATPSVNKACSFSSFTATASSQVAQVAACATAVGNIVIEGDAFGAIDLTGVQQIYGSLQVNNATKAVSLLAPTLQLVAGELALAGNTILSNLNLAQLTTVGTLTFNALPALEQTGLTSGITSADSIIISDTGLKSLTGINVFQLKVLDVNNNQDINTIDSGLQSVTDSLSVSYNAEKVDVTFDQLTTANSVFLQSINSLSANNLTTINGSLALSSNSVDKIEFANLQSVGKSLVIDKNDDLEELDFPKLTSIGGALQVTDNTDLKTFDGFPKLQLIGGSVTLDGKFDNGTFESLQRVAGGFNLTSTGDLSCDSFTKLNKDGDIKGDKFYCQGASSTISSSSSKKGNSNGASTDSASASDSSSSSSSSSSGTAKKNGASTTSPVQIVSVFVAFVAVGAALY